MKEGQVEEKGRETQYTNDVVSGKSKENKRKKEMDNKTKEKVKDGANRQLFE